MSSTGDERPRAVLVVDDDADVRETVGDVLRDAGHSVFTAGDGSEALRLLDGGEVPRPCLILLDWLMFPMSGSEFLRLLARRPDVERLPVLFISPVGAPGELDPACRLVGRLQKPFGLQELLAAVAAAR